MGLDCCFLPRLFLSPNLKCRKIYGKKKKKKAQRVQFCFVCANYWLFLIDILHFGFGFPSCVVILLSKSHLCYCLGFLLHPVISDLLSEPQHTETVGTHCLLAPTPHLTHTPLAPAHVAFRTLQSPDELICWPRCGDHDTPEAGSGQEMLVGNICAVCTCMQRAEIF